jgi:short-subunit dehydrogenase
MNPASRRSTALVTGASSGIGWEFARRLAKEKYDLVLLARRTDRLNQLRMELEPRGTRVTILDIDLSRDGAAQRAFDAVRLSGVDVDVLINNAGFGVFGPFAETDLDKETQMIHVNVVALTEFAKLFGAAMVGRKRGAIVNVASTAGFVPGPLMAVYYATKAYVISLSEALSYEWASSNVSVTALCPGATLTEFQEAADMKKSRLFKRKLPTAKDVADFGYGAMVKKERLAVHGLGNRVLLQSLRTAPRALLPWVVEQMQKART